MATRKEQLERAAAKSEERDLADEPTQEKILHPKGTKITIGGREAKLYPLSARSVRKLSFLFKEALISAQGNYFRSVTVACDQDEERVREFIALSLFAKPEDVEVKQLTAFRKELVDAEEADLSGNETEAAFRAVLEVNDVIGILNKAYGGVDSDEKKDGA